MTKRKRQVVIVDLFAGGGGASNGAKSAIKLRDVVVKQFVAVNHWADAIATHEANHPDAKHYHCAVEEVDPRQAIKGGRIDLLIAGPSCTFHSIAQGGRPLNEQSRSSPYSILNWTKDIFVRALIIENVPEWAKWGPLNAKGRPIKKLQGTSFKGWLTALESQGYKVEWRVLNAADYGDATSRKRLFVLARRHGCGPILWPEPTRVKPFPKTDQLTLFQPVKPSWRVTREIIDFSIPMGPETSIFNRKRPLSANTMRRIYVGLYKYGLRDFVIGQQSGAVPRDVDQPLPTVAAAGGISLIHPFVLSIRGGNDVYTRAGEMDSPLPTITADNPMALITPQPFLLPPEGVYKGNAPRSLDEPLNTITQRGGGALVQPFIVKLRGHNNAADIDLPLPTVTAGGNHLFLADPYLIEYHGGPGNEERVLSLDETLPTQTTENRFAILHPYIVSSAHGGPADRVASMDNTLPTIAGHGELAMVQPFIVTAAHGSGNGRGNDGRVRSVDSPLPTIDNSGGLGIAQPYIIQYHGTSLAHSLDEPLNTIPSRDHFALCVPLVQGYLLIDILFRMLHWSELAAAMSFPKSYIWVNAKKKHATKKQITKMIGNAWPNETGGQLCYMQLR